MRRATPVTLPDLHTLRTARMRRLSVPAEAVREELRDAVRNEHLVRSVVIGLWMTAAFLFGLIVAITR